MWWTPGPFVEPGEGVGEARHVGGRLAGEHRRQVAVVAEGVAVGVVGPQPVEAPHVLPPADDLADEPLGAVQRDRSGAVRVLDPVADLVGQEQAEVQVRAQHRVGERPRPAAHGVLVGAEPHELVIDEVAQAGEGGAT